MVIWIGRLNIGNAEKNYINLGYICQEKVLGVVVIHRNYTIW